MDLAQQEKDNQKVTYTYDLVINEDGAPLIKVDYEGKECYIFLDTGANNCALNPEYKELIVEECGQQTDSVTTASGNIDVEYRMVKVPVPADVYCIAYTSDNISIFNHFREVYGIECIFLIGSTFLDATNAIIDYDNKKLSFTV